MLGLQANDLINKLKEDGEEFEEDFYFTAGYDAPFKYVALPGCLPLKTKCGSRLALCTAMHPHSCQVSWLQGPCVKKRRRAGRTQLFQCLLAYPVGVGTEHLTSTC